MRSIVPAGEVLSGPTGTAETFLTREHEAGCVRLQRTELCFSSSNKVYYTYKAICIVITTFHVIQASWVPLRSSVIHFLFVFGFFFHVWVLTRTTMEQHSPHLKNIILLGLRVLLIFKMWFKTSSNNLAQWKKGWQVCTEWILGHLEFSNSRPQQPKYFPRPNIRLFVFYLVSHMHKYNWAKP